MQRVRSRRARRTHPLPGRVAGALWRVEEESTFETNLRPRVFDLRSRVVAFDLMVRRVTVDSVRGFSIGSGLVAHGARRNDAARARSDVDETVNSAGTKKSVLNDVARREV